MAVTREVMGDEVAVASAWVGLLPAARLARPKGERVEEEMVVNAGGAIRKEVWFGFSSSRPDLESWWWLRCLLSRGSRLDPNPVQGE